MLKLLDDKLNTAVLVEIRKRNPLHLRDDKFAWLNESIAAVHAIPLEDIPDLLGTRLSEYYHGVIAFHACRPVSLESYEKNGLEPSDTEALRIYARKLFGDTPALADAIASLRGDYVGHNRGCIWLSLTKEQFFLNGHSHYLERGSELLSAIANAINQQDKLRTIGIPTIVECVLLKSQLPEAFWSGLSRQMLEDWFTRFLRPRELRSVCTYCVDVRTQVPREQIVRFHQFEEVKSKYRWYWPGRKLRCDSLGFRPRRNDLPSR